MSTLNSKSIAFSAEGNPPQLEDVANVVTVALAFDMSVCIICFTQEMLDHWLLTLDHNSAESDLTLLDVLDSTMEIY